VRSVLVFAWLVILGGKLATIGAFGTDLPYWDQWAKEGEHILMPWFRGQSFLTGLVSPHNEHRIVPTLLLNLGLVVGGGQWDARVQCIASAAVHATVLVGLVGWAWRRVGRNWGLAALGLAALIGALPIAWDNVLGGFQSQYYFLAGASLLAMERLLSAPVARWGWWVGLAFGLVALVCMGSGSAWWRPLSSGIVLLRAVRREPRGRDHVATFLAAALGPWRGPLAARGRTLACHLAGQGRRGLCALRPPKHGLAGAGSDGLRAARVGPVGDPGGAADPGAPRRQETTP
jgi:hypothetical protein